MVASAWPFSQSLPIPSSHPVHDQGEMHIMSVGPVNKKLREFTQPFDQIKEADVTHRLGVIKVMDESTDEVIIYETTKDLKQPKCHLNERTRVSQKKHSVTLFL